MVERTDPQRFPRQERRRLGTIGPSAWAPHGPAVRAADPASPAAENRGSQRLSIEKLEKWEGLGYGMFIHFGMNTFEPEKRTRRQGPGLDLRPRQARRGPMDCRGPRLRHEVRHAGGQARGRPLPLAQQVHRLHGGQQHGQDERLEKFVESCRKRGVAAGPLLLLVGQPQPLRQPESPTGAHAAEGRGSYGGMSSFPRQQMPRICSPYTTSLYQTFQTAQVTELLTAVRPDGRNVDRHSAACWAAATGSSSITTSPSSSRRPW